MLGAYGTALATDFNGFGSVEFVAVEDMPWPSMFEVQSDQAEDDQSTVINFARARRRRPRLKRRA